MYDLKNTYDLLFVLSAVLNNERIDTSKLKALDLKEIYSLSKNHSLVSATYIALEPYFTEFADDKLISRWKKEKSEVVFKQVNFDIEREKILSFLSSIGCWYMQLKGTILKSLYVNSSMRDMSDNDILFDESFSAQLKDFMVSNGYKAQVDIGKDDSYTKPPFYNFEMHRTLVDNSDKPVFVEYYKDIKSKLVSSKDNPCERFFTDEDFYIYMVLHEFEHYSGGGTGLRALVDTYVYLKAKSDNMNRDYIISECKALGIDEFEKAISTLSNKLLAYPQVCDLSADEEDMLVYIATSGTYGNRENHIENDLKSQFGDDISKLQKLRYFFGRIFLPVKSMKSKYPLIRKYPFLLPLGYMHRIFIRGFSDLGRFWEEIKMVWKK